jgi:hypothetical protein
MADDCPTVQSALDCLEVGGAASHEGHLPLLELHVERFLRRDDRVHAHANGIDDPSCGEWLAAPDARGAAIAV